MKSIPLWITELDLETKTVTLSNEPPPDGERAASEASIYTMERDGEVQTLRMKGEGKWLTF